MKGRNDDDNATDIQENHTKHAHTFQTLSAEDVFFDSCKIRIAKLDPASRAALQIQITQLFYNAENPTLPAQSVMELPRQPQLQVSQAWSEYQEPADAEQQRAICVISQTQPSSSSKDTHAKGSVTENPEYFVESSNMDS